MEVGFDADIGRWILEFVLRQPLDDGLLNSLISIYPLPNDSSSLKKALLLRKIESLISKGFVFETLLDLLEQIEELDFQGREHSSSISRAYLAVAVACTVEHLGNSKCKVEYFDAVKRIWKGRVCNLEKSESVGLVSEDLQGWKDDIEAAIWEEGACGLVLKRSEGIDAIDAVSAYVQEERRKMGPSFLESIAEAVKVDQQLMDLLEVGEKGVDLRGDGGNSVPVYKNRVG